MITKTFEVRDSCTFIPIIAIKLIPTFESDRYLLSRAGWGETAKEQATHILVSRLDGGKSEMNCDPYSWTDSPRTLRVAHRYLIEHFDELKSGAVIDVEFILGESAVEKTPEALIYGDEDEATYWRAIPAE